VTKEQFIAILQTAVATIAVKERWTEEQLRRALDDVPRMADQIKFNHPQDDDSTQSLNE